VCGTRSPRVYRGFEELTYPYHDATITVTHCGRLCFQGRKVNLSQVFAGQNVGVTRVGEHVWLVTFMQYDLGYFDDETGRLEPIDYPFGRKCYLCARGRHKLLPMCPEWTPHEKSGRVDLNHRPPGPEPGALTGLRYAPKSKSTNLLSRVVTLPKNRDCARMRG
jgi:hypothetical protein